MSQLDHDLHTLANSVAHANDMEALVRPMLKLISRCSGLESVYLTLIDNDKTQQQVWLAENYGELQISEGLKVDWDDTLCKRALDEGRYVVMNVPNCWGSSQAASELKIQTYASVPVHHVHGDQQLLGTLCGASRRGVEIGDEVTELLHLCGELIALQLSRKAHLMHALERATQAEARLNKVELNSQISRQCLEAQSLPSILAKVAELLGQDSSWSAIDAFHTVLQAYGDYTLSALNQANDHSIALAERLLRDEHELLQVIIRNQADPLIWADPEEQVLALVVTSDDSVDALLLVYLQQDLAQCQDSKFLLSSTTNSLSLLASRLEDHRRLEAANQVLEHHALHDVLTGLPNRRFLIEKLEDKLSEGERLEVPIYIAFVDLDGFKAINDTHGHDLGDVFLQLFAARLTQVLRGHDLVARYGGDEFVFVGVGSPEDDFKTVQHQLITRIREATSGVYELGPERSEWLDYTGPSVGLIEWQPGDVCDADVAIAKADAAMYEDKKQRRNQLK
ncbi:MAG: sensor domain-containing diguanylate cyclase [Firmicutes bacterium]|nr:sensor domain-containing diguanylate cyclase [Bacillota bacterium]